MVTFEGAKSKKTIQGVPPGSILSPLLFHCYIGDLHWGAGDLHLSFFDDDVAIMAQDSKLHIVDKVLQQSLDAVTTWSKEWNILLSTQKSECSYSTNSHESKWQPTLTLDGQPVCYNATLKFLGVTYDRQLTFSCHAALVGNSLKRQTGALQKVTSTSWGCDRQTLRTTYIATGRSNVEYGASSWLPWISNLPMENLEKR